MPHNIFITITNKECPFPFLHHFTISLIDPLTILPHGLWVLLFFQENLTGFISQACHFVPLVPFVDTKVKRPFLLMNIIFVKELDPNIHLVIKLLTHDYDTLFCFKWYIVHLYNLSWLSMPLQLWLVANCSFLQEPMDKLSHLSYPP